MIMLIRRTLLVVCLMMVTSWVQAQCLQCINNTMEHLYEGTCQTGEIELDYCSETCCGAPIGWACPIPDYAFECGPGRFSFRRASLIETTNARVAKMKEELRPPFVGSLVMMRNQQRKTFVPRIQPQLAKAPRPMRTGRCA
jgi:hypothetical protein